MSPDQAFKLIEEKRWAVVPQCGGGWVVEDADLMPGGDDGDIIEIARTRGTLMDAILMACEGQVLARK